MCTVHRDFLFSLPAATSASFPTSPACLTASAIQLWLILSCLVPFALPPTTLETFIFGLPFHCKLSLLPRKAILDQQGIRQISVIFTHDFHTTLSSIFSVQFTPRGQNYTSLIFQQNAIAISGITGRNHFSLSQPTKMFHSHAWISDI